MKKKAQEAFIIYKNKLEGLIDTLKKNIDKTKKQIIDMTNCVTTEDAIIASAGAKTSRNDTLRTSARNMCSNFAKEFADATKNRLEEIQTILEIIVIIEKRFSKIPADLKSYLQNVESGWKAYMNSTAFAKYIEYQQKHLAENKQGAVLGKAVLK